MPIGSCYGRRRIPEAFYYPNSTWRQWLGGYKFQSQPGVRYLRLYGPLEPWFDKTWRPGEIEPQK
jgi:hypothetical protein